jgi:DNA-binding HxlR family transcriptional regulator
MRSYGQYCAIAKALDVVGDRWTMLIVRELLARGECRYTDLRDGLPGIASNLLAERLRSLEAAGVVTRRQAPPPVAATLLALTERGRALEPVIDALGQWGIPFMAEGPAPGDEFRSRWLAWPAETFLSDHSPDDPPVAIELRTSEKDEPTVIETVDGAVRARQGECEQPDVVLTGSPYAILGVLSGHVTLAEARAGGLGFDGDPQALARLQPLALAA